MSLTKCIKKAGKALDRDDADAIRNLRDGLVSDGMGSVEAGIESVKLHIQDVLAEREGIVGQVEEQGGAAPAAPSLTSYQADAVEESDAPVRNERAAGAAESAQDADGGTTGSQAVLGDTADGGNNTPGTESPGAESVSDPDAAADEQPALTAVDAAPARRRGKPELLDSLDELSEPGVEQGEIVSTPNQGAQLYHGTNAENLEAIENAGKITGPVYLTPRRDMALEYSDGESVVEVWIPEDALKIDFDLPGGRLLTVEEANRYSDNEDWTIQDYIDDGRSVGVEQDVLIRPPARRPGSPELLETIDRLEAEALSLPVPVSAEDVPYQSGYDAYRNISHTPDDRARQEQIEYLQEMLDVHEDMAGRATDENRGDIVSELERYRDNYLRMNWSVLSAKSRTASAYITGGSNFPEARNRKRLDTEQKRLDEFLSWREKARKSINKKFAPEESRAISSTDPEAIGKLRTKLEGLEQAQERMKAANKVVRSKKLAHAEKIQQLQDDAGLSEDQAKDLLKPDFAGRPGFPQYALSNNNAEIKRLRDRITALESRQETAEAVGGSVTAEFEGGEVEVDYEGGYVRVRHDQKPPAEVRQSLKSGGFRWAPSEGAWRRKLTNQALWKASQITGAKIPEPATGTERFSRGESPTNAHDQASLADTMNPAFPGVFAALEKAGLARIVTRDEIPASVDPAKSVSSQGRVLAYVQDGQVTFVADNIAKGHNVRGLMLHEIGVHLRQLGQGDTEFQSILKQFEGLARIKGSKAAVAMARVPEDTPAHLRVEEGLGYLVELSPEVPLAKRLADWFRAQLKKWLGSLKGLDRTRLMKWANGLSESDLITMATQAVKSAPAAARQTTSREAMASAPRDKWYRSALSENIGGIRQMAGKDGMIGPKQAKDWIAAGTKKGLYKADEVEWVGLNDWLDLQEGKVSVDAIQAFVDANGVQVEDVELGDGEPTKYGDYQLPGGSNYREVLLTLPTKEQIVNEVRHDPEGSKEFPWAIIVDGREVNRSSSEGAARIQLQEEVGMAGRSGGIRGTYASSHWEQPNVLAHIRMNDRTDSDGARVLFIEEIQSDWAQEGRKHGFAGTEALGWRVTPRGSDQSILYGPQQEEAAETKAAELGVSVDPILDEAGTPSAPFVGRTDSWVPLAMKRIVSLAAEGGYDKVAFVNGEQQVQRYWGDETVSGAVGRFNEVTKPQSVREFANDVFGAQMAELMSLDVVDGGMLAALKNDKIKRVVIESISIDVMNDLARFNVTPDEILSNPNVLSERLPLASRRRAANGVLGAVRDTGATIRTKLSNLGLGRGEIELFPTLRASDLNSREVAGIIAPSAIFHGGTGAVSEKEGAATRSVAKPLSPEERGVFGDKFSSAKLAEFLNAHAEIIHGKEGLLKQGFEAPPHDGMKAFYDQIVPKVARDVLKKTGGGKVESATLDTGSQTAFTITDAMRQKVQEGLPLFSRADDSGFGPPDETLTTAAIRKIQDKFKVLKDLQTNIRQAGGQIDEASDAYLGEELFHGKAENDLRLMRDGYVKPLADKMAKFGVTRAELDEYLYAKHAPERNQHIASINPDMPDGGSGMTDLEAGRVLVKVKKSGKQEQYDQLAAIVYDMTKLQRDLIRQSGLEDDGTIAAWENKYRFYVPLKGWAEDTKDQGIPRTGKGFTIGGRESKRALGRSTEAASPVSYAITDLTEKLIRKRKNEVGNAFLNLVQKNPNKDYWQVFTDENPDTDRRLVKVRDPQTGEMVEQVRETPVPMHMMSDKYFTTKKGGKTYFIKLEDPRLMKAMKNLGPETNNGLIRTMSSIIRVMSSLNTSYAPEFVISNFARDIQTAVLNLQAEQSLEQGKAAGKKIAAKTVKDTPRAMRAIHASLRGKKLKGKAAKWQEMFDQFRADGAKTGWFDMKDLDGQAKDIDRLVSMAQGGAKGAALKFLNASAEVVENLNQSVENAVRLSAYTNAIEAGISRQKAASLAKNMTVNFNRRGEIGTTLNALYMFANASIQGTANFARTMVTMKDQGKGWGRLNTAQKIAVGIVAGSYFLAMANRMAAGDDDDDENWYDKIPDYVRERNLVIMKSMFGGEQNGEYWKIPLPYGYNVFHVLGDGMESVFSGNKSAAEAATEMTLATLGSFSPIGFQDSQSVHGLFLKNAAPTLMKPIVDVALNENFMGSTIYSENFPFGTPKPDSALGRRSTPAAYQKFATWLNETTGGSEYRPGSIDINPDVMRYFIDYFGGSAYSFVGSKVPDVAYRYATGQEVESFRTPLLSRVTGKVLPYEDMDRFYRRRDEVNQLYEELKNIPMAARRAFANEYDSKLRLRGLIKGSEKQLKLIRQQRDRIYEMDITPAERDKRLKEVEQRMKAVVDRFNKAYATAS